MNIDEDHCMKSVQIQNLFSPVFSRIRTEYGEILSIWTLFTVDNAVTVIWFSFTVTQSNSTCYDVHAAGYNSIVTNSGLGGGGVKFKSGPFYFLSTKAV